MDAGSYSKEIIKLVASNSKLFYIRANKSEDLYGQITEIENWETMEINYKNYEYNYFVEKVSLFFEDIKPITRLKRFIFRFISVAGKWVYTGRQWVLKLFSNRPYEVLVI